MKLAPVCLALFGLSLPALADAVVYPTGDPTQDVPAVRAAVQAGGTVLLKAVDVEGEPQVFDFGDFPVGPINWNEAGSGYVPLGTSGEIVAIVTDGPVFFLSLGNDVHLLGETVGDAKTTIQGGTIPVRNLAPLQPGSTALVVGVGNLTVEGIRFTESALQPVYLTQLASFPEVRAFAAELGLDLEIKIKDNAFVDTQPALTFLWLSQAAMADGPLGRVSIADNVLQLTLGRWDEELRTYELEHGLNGPLPELREGLTIADLYAPGTLTGNRVQNVDVGLHVWFEGSDSVRIADNTVELRENGLYGIALEANHRYVVERNTVIAPGRFPDGISLWASDPTVGINHSTIRHNKIVMDGSDFGGITLYTGGSDNVFSHNVVEGSAAYALGLASPFLPAVFFATGNTFRGNKIHRFTPRDSSFWGSGAHILFDENAIGNVLLGWSGIVKDLGTDNSATGWNNRGTGHREARRTAFAAAGPGAKHDLVPPLRPQGVHRDTVPRKAPPTRTAPGRDDAVPLGEK
jgi:hypothetical protein